MLNCDTVALIEQFNLKFIFTAAQQPTAGLKTQRQKRNKKGIVEVCKILRLGPELPRVIALCRTAILNWSVNSSACHGYSCRLT